jgi:hypothetical protein
MKYTTVVTLLIALSGIGALAMTTELITAFGHVTPGSWILVVLFVVAAYYFFVAMTYERLDRFDRELRSL